MDFSNIPYSFYKRIFNALNMVLLACWALMITDYALPRKNSEERVTEIEKIESYTTTGSQNALHEKLVVDYLVHTEERAIFATDLVEGGLIAEGDTVMMEASPIIGAVYGLGGRSSENPGNYEMRRIQYEEYEFFEFSTVASILLLLLAMIPRLSYVNRGTLAFFSYVFLSVCIAGYNILSF